LTSGTVFTAALVFLGAIVTGTLGLLGALFTRIAPQLSDLNAAQRLLVEGYQAEVQRLTVRDFEKDQKIDKLEQAIELLQDRLGDASRDREELKGEIRQLQQRLESTAKLLLSKNITPIPDNSLLNKEQK